MQTPYYLLAPWLQAVLFLALLFFAYLSFRQRQWKGAAKAAETAANAAVTELEIRREIAERLAKENRELIATNTALLCRTDLTPIVESITMWTNESRGHFLQAMQRLEAIHKEQTDAMRAVTQHLTQLSLAMIPISERKS